MVCFQCHKGWGGVNTKLAEEFLAGIVVKLTEPVRGGCNWAGHEFFSTEQLRRCATTRRSEQLGHPWALIRGLTANLILIM